MKKRFISMLLAVLLVVSLFAGTSVSAYADGEYKTVSYTLVKGDTLLQICNNMGLNFYTCQTAINKLNNFTSEAQYRKLYVGQVIKLPATNEDAAKIASSYISGSTGSGTVVNTGSSSGSTGNVSGNVAYWLIPYTIQRGETVVGVCNTLGISFNTYSSQIMKINNISSWNKVAAGKTLLLPTAVKPAAGISCYAVIAHKVAQGETTYGICQNYGISYTSNASLMQALNPSVNFNFIKYNTTMLVPVPTVITAGTTGGTTSGGTTSGGTTSGNTNSGSTNSGTGSSTKTYTISASSNGGGSVSFTVNGKSATAAAAGSTVTIKANPQSNKTLESVKVVYADNSAVLPVNNGTFTMPECNVRVEAKFGTGYLVSAVASPSGGGSTSITVDNVSVTHAVKGATVKVSATPRSGYTLSDITVKNFSGKVIASGLSSGSTFTMPGERVLVYVNFKSVATYGFTKSTDGNGSFVLKVKGSEVTSAAAGATVDIVASPYNGYGLDTVTVTAVKNGEKIAVNNNSFIMPASDVKVEATFGAAKYSIMVNNSATGGTASANPSNATPGKTVTLTANPYAGYAIDYYIVNHNGEDHTIKADSSGAYTFVMPAADVVVTPVFRTRATVLTINNTDASIATVTVKDSSGNVVNSGSNVQTWSTYSLETNMLQSGYNVVISVNGQQISGSSFTTDGSASIEVKVEYTRKDNTLTVENNWIGFFELVVNSQSTKVTSAGQTLTVPTGVQVTVQLLDEYRNDYRIVGVQVDGKSLPDGQNWFNMPGANAKVKVLIEQNPTQATSVMSADSLAPIYEEDGLAPLA